MDDTINICEKWVNENKEIFVRTCLVTTDKNTGTPANCNRGLKLAKGDWIKFIAGDDALLKNCIQSNIAYILSNKNAKMVQSNCEYYLKNFDESNYLFTTNLCKKKFFNANYSSLNQYKLLLLRNRVKAAAVFFNKESLLMVGGFDERLKLMEDLPLWLNLTKNNIKIHCLDITTVKYRLSDTSVIRYRKPFMTDVYACETLLFYQYYVKGNISAFASLRFKLYIYGIIFLNRIGLNKKGIINRILFKAVTVLQP
ncbi:MAG: glycosyltransferase [Segetibacter sp.]